MTTRKGFLATGVAISAFAPQLALADAQPSATAAPMPHLDFDLSSFDATLKRPAKHHHLFAAKAANSAAYGTMRGVLVAYESIGIPAKDVLPVAVLYHVAVVLGFDDTIWNELLLPNLPKLPQGLRDDLGSPKAGAGNPYLHVVPGATNDFSLDGLVADASAHVFICNNALTGLSSALAKASGADAAATYTQITKHLTPSTTIVPAGIWGVHAVQERGYTLLQVN